jgi:phosphoserine phosphatase
MRKVDLDLGPGWLPENVEALADLIARVGRGSPSYDPAHPPYAVFDWDNTCLAGDLGDAFFYGACRRAALPLREEAIWNVLTPSEEREALYAAWQAVASQAGNVNQAALAAFRWQMARSFRLLAQRIHDWAYAWQTQALAGLTPSQVEALTDLIIEEESRRPLGHEVLPAPDGRREAELIPQGLRLYPQMAELRRRLEMAGIISWVVTATSEIIVRAGAHRLGFARERVLGTRSQLADGRITGQIKETFACGPGKVELIRRYIHPTQRPVLVVADGLTDRDMLEYGSDVRLVIDRGVPGLKERAEAGRARGERWLLQPPFPEVHGQHLTVASQQI